MFATRLHVISGRFSRPGCFQPSLFDAPDPKLEAVAEAKRQINDKLGRFTVRSGATLYANRFYADPANLHDVCDIRGKFTF